ncbi:unnamed protein product, partial [marine sediment metagenome]
MPQRVKRGESAEFTLSQTQVQALLSACNDLDERVTINAQLFLGLRVGEVAHLRADWVTQEGNLKIPSQQVCRCAECARERGGTWHPKTKAGARTVPIPQRMKKDLSELFKAKPYGMEVSRIGLWGRTKRILKRARITFKGLSDNTAFPHALRSTCATMLAVGGMSPVGLCAFAYAQTEEQLSVDGN